VHQSSTLSIGMDVHNDTIAVAYVAQAHAAAPWSKRPGRTGIPPRSVATCHFGWQYCQSRSMTAIGRPKCGCAHAFNACWPAANMPTRGSSPWPKHSRAFCESLPNEFESHHKAQRRPPVGPSLRTVHNIQRKRRAPVWCNPRRRDETGRHPRASSEAGTRRMQVRWSPTHE
jgi:hypothetical protein